MTFVPVSTYVLRKKTSNQHRNDFFFFKFLNLLLQNRFKSKNYDVQLASSSLSSLLVSNQRFVPVVLHHPPSSTTSVPRGQPPPSLPVISSHQGNRLALSFFCMLRSSFRTRQTNAETTATRSFLICPNETAGFRSLQCLLTKAKRMLWLRQNDTVS